MINLISIKQVYCNLRRSATKDKISLLSATQINKHFEKYYYDKQQDKCFCPYTGKELTKETAILEHIIPISCGGGTVLFNCIPALKSINGPNEKGARHLLDWWPKSGYFSEARLQTLIDYMISAYEEVFQRENIQLMIDSEEELVLEEINREIDEIDFSNEKKLLEQTKMTGQLESFSFLNDCIALLSNDKNKKYYEEKIARMKNDNAFKEIEKYEEFYSIFKDILREKFYPGSREYLTISLKYNLSELINSMPNDVKAPQEIREEISRRLNNIANILEKNDISIYSYFDNLGSSQIQNVLAKEKLTEEETKKFIEELELCPRDKFRQLINYVENNGGKLPSRKNPRTKQEKILGKFCNRIQDVNNYSFKTKLTKEELKELHNSKYESLNKIYKNILYKATLKKIKIEYVDDEIKKKMEFALQELSKNKAILSQIEIKNKYKEVIKVSPFFELIYYVENNGGKLPSSKSKDPQTRKLGKFRRTLQTVIKTKGGATFKVRLSEEELKLLHDSKYESLNEIYKSLVARAKTNNIDKYISIDNKIQKEEQRKEKR
ncbi:MAG: hypothetical protein IJH13_04220 [Bacilli bacterium]|nr:hypothetical protein [Bacilli bacterium]